MRYFLPLISACLHLAAGPESFGQGQSVAGAPGAPLRAAVVGLVHGHAEGFFEQNLRRSDLQIVGVAERDIELASKYASRFGLDRNLLYSDFEEMFQKTRPQAVLVYTNTLDHRKVVEICAKHGIHVMMEKPLAVSVEDARAIERAAKQGKIQVMVNYETTWYRSNRAAYDLAHVCGFGP